LKIVASTLNVQVDQLVGYNKKTKPRYHCGLN
jgi:hypothetical protein